MSGINQLDIIAELFQARCNTKLTVKNKDYQWKIFSEFCKTYGEIPIPVSVDTLVRYSVYLIVHRKCCEGTVRNHLSNIRRYHKLYLNVDIPSPSQCPPLEAVLKGGSKYLGKTVKQKYPVTANILTALVLTVPFNSPFKTLYNLLFFGLPRVGNILPYTSSKFSVIRHLTWDKLVFSDSGTIVTLPVTKTIQNFERLLRIPISDSSQRLEFCLKSGLRSMMSLPGYPCDGKDPVFNIYQDGKWIPLSKKIFSVF